MQRKGEGHDQIKICEDTDGDGQADKFTVFADKLSIPTSLTFAGGGLIVHQAPDTLLLKDTDGDDKADVRQVLFTGWGTNDTHAGPSNLRYGFDNWVYGIVGYSGFKGEIGGEKHEFRQGLYRFRPDGSKLEFLRNTNNNSWGVGFSEEGLLFGSTANGCPSVYLPIPYRYYEKVRGLPDPGRLQASPTQTATSRSTEKVRQVDYFGGFTAAAGHALYTARLLPSTYWNSVAFVAEPTGHLVATFALEKVGSDFKAHNEWNLLASDDEWTAPVAAEVGPDGGVWVSDWYNYIVQHNPTPKGFGTGKGNAYETPLRDKTHGRIYRVVPTGMAAAATTTKLDPADGPALVAALGNDNLCWRLHAQRLLVERGKKDVVPALIALVREAKVDAIGLAPAAIHALWTLHGLGALDGSEPAATDAASPRSGIPRRASGGTRCRFCPAGAQGGRGDPRRRLLDDADPLVRLAALLALADAPPSPEAAEAIVAAIADGQGGGDRWLPDAATAAAAANADGFLKALAARQFRSRPRPRSPPSPAGSPSTWPGASAPGRRRTSSSAWRPPTPAIADAVVAGLAAAGPRTSRRRSTTQTDRALITLLTKVSPGARAQLVSLAGRWGSKAIEAKAGEIAATFLASVGDDKLAEPARIDAAKRLVDFRPNDAKVVESLLAMITPRTSQGLAIGLVDAVGQSASPRRRAGAGRQVRRHDPDRPECRGPEPAQPRRVDRGLPRRGRPRRRLAQATVAPADPGARGPPGRLDRQPGQDPDRPRRRPARRRPPEGHRPDRPGRPQGGRPGQGEARLHPAVRQVPHVRRRRGQGRPRPDRDGHAPPRGVAHPHPRPEPERRGELRPVHPGDERRSGPQRPARRPSRRRRSSCSTPRGSRSGSCARRSRSSPRRRSRSCPKGSRSSSAPTGWPTCWPS